jgi:hypothetical protein
MRCWAFPIFSLAFGPAFGTTCVNVSRRFIIIQEG